MTYNEGNTKYRLTFRPMNREYKVTSETYLPGEKKPLLHAVSIHDHLVDGEQGAMEFAVKKLRPQVARAEAKHRGEDIAVTPDPAIDRAVEAERRQAAERAKAEAEAIAIKEAAGRTLNEQHPMWGMF